MVQQKIQYAKVKSDLIAKLQGSFAPREKRPRPEKQAKEKKEKKRPAKKVKAEDDADGEPRREAAVPSALPPQAKAEPPNNKLFVQNLPEQTNAMMLQMLFQQYVSPSFV